MAVLKYLSPSQLASFTLESGVINNKEHMCQILAKLQNKPLTDIYEYLDQFNTVAQKVWYLNNAGNPQVMMAVGTGISITKASHCGTTVLQDHVGHYAGRGRSPRQAGWWCMGATGGKDTTSKCYAAWVVKSGSRKLAGNMRNCHHMMVGCCNVIITNRAPRSPRDTATARTPKTSSIYILKQDLLFPSPNQLSHFLLFLVLPQALRIISAFQMPELSKRSRIGSAISYSIYIKF